MEGLIAHNPPDVQMAADPLLEEFFNPQPEEEKETWVPELGMLEVILEVQGSRSDAMDEYTTMVDKTLQVIDALKETSL